MWFYSLVWGHCFLAWQASSSSLAPSGEAVSWLQVISPHDTCLHSSSQSIWKSSLKNTLQKINLCRCSIPVLCCLWQLDILERCILEIHHDFVECCTWKWQCYEKMPWMLSLFIQIQSDTLQAWEYLTGQHVSRSWQLDPSWPSLALWNNHIPKSDNIRWQRISVSGWAGPILHPSCGRP